MNFRDLAVAAGLAALLSACATTKPVGDEQGADVVDNSLNSGQSTDAQGATDSSESYGLNPQDQFEGSELDNPESLLSNTTIFFEFDSADLPSDALPVIEAHAQFMTKNSEYQLQIEGHTDDRGSREYNIGLGERRAAAVRRAFQLHGVDPSRITLVSFGEEKPMALGENDEFWSKNRRAELVY